MSEQRLSSGRSSRASWPPTRARPARRPPFQSLGSFRPSSRFASKAKGKEILKKIQRTKQAFRFLQARAAALSGSSFLLLSGGFRLEGAYVVVTAFEEFL
jgi:hypothetical protein